MEGWSGDLLQGIDIFGDIHFDVKYEVTYNFIVDHWGLIILVKWFEIYPAFICLFIDGILTECISFQFVNF